MAYEFEAAARQWQEEGVAVVEGLIPTDDIDAVADDLARLYGGDTFDDYNRAAGFGDGTPDGKQFRSTQFEGMRGFPFHGCARLNDLYVHPRLIEFAKAALADDDIRIYQASAWGKWAGAVNYEQPLHQDGNHSLLPPRMEPGFWHLETFLFCRMSTRTAPRRVSCRAASRTSTTTRCTPTKSPRLVSAAR